MLVGTGIDIIEFNRFRNLKDKGDFVRQVLTENEIGIALRRSNQDIFYATAFAVKEAILKALGCGLHDGSHWHEVELNDRWETRLSGRLAALASQQSVTVIHSSQSCTENCVVALVLLENND